MMPILLSYHYYQWSLLLLWLLSNFPRDSVIFGHYCPFQNYHLTHYRYQALNSEVLASRLAHRPCIISGGTVLCVLSWNFTTKGRNEDCIFRACFPGTIDISSPYKQRFSPGHVSSSSLKTSMRVALRSRLSASYSNR